MRFQAIIITIFVMCYASITHAAIPTEMEAAQLVFDQGRSVVTATGNVTVNQGAQTLSADKIIYNFADDLAYAEGDVILTDANGDSHSADVLELNDNMRAGIVDNLMSRLNDGSRLWAVKAIRESQQKHILKDARYTPCRECETNPDKTPAWALRASEVVHDKGQAMIHYDDVRFEAWGMPVFYAPYFAHPDGSVQQKSGFLTPDIQFGSDYGFNFMSPYYWAISSSMDATIGVRVFTKETPQLNLEMRKRFEDAALTVETSATSSERTDSVNGVDVARDDEFRGHIVVDGLWDVSNKWRAGAELALATDEQYLDQYNIMDEDVLENRLYVERFDNRDYASVELLAFQDLRLDEQVDQPNALPYANMRFTGKPDGVLGGRTQWDTSFLSLYREGNEQDMNRLSSSLAWQKQSVSTIGLVSTLDLSVRGDSYYTTDRDIAKTDLSEKGDKLDTRFIPTANLEMAYPLQKSLQNAVLKIKPKIGLTARPDIDNDSDVPNEDSADAQLDYNNLFAIDRFPGLDRVEDRTRVNYGLEGGYYTDTGSEFTFGLGQSYRLENDDNPFPNGSGLTQQSSDVVGKIGASFDNHKHNVNYRFQLDGQHFSSERHELYGQTSIYDTDLSAIYLFEKGSEGTEFVESREQIRMGARHKFNETWSASTSALYDLGEDQGLREARFGVTYEDDCFGIAVEGERDLQREATGANDTSVFVRLFLKNLGEFETKAYDSQNDNDADE
jgi:LPS-assembly protein